MGRGELSAEVLDRINDLLGGGPVIRGVESDPRLAAHTVVCILRVAPSPAKQGTGPEAVGTITAPGGRSDKTFYGVVKRIFRDR